jgi:hypothetical protein
MAVSTDPVTPVVANRSKWRLPRPLLLTGVLIVILLAGVITFFVQHMANGSPVSSDVQKAVTFPVYYPRQSKMPAGYGLDSTSFRLADTGVVIYSVEKGDQQLIFSEQQTPEATIIDKFISSYIPLHNTITTDLGKAAMGAAGQGSNLKTIVSLPIAKGPWLIITAPANTKQSDVQQILQALTK